MYSKDHAVNCSHLTLARIIHLSKMCSKVYVASLSKLLSPFHHRRKNNFSKIMSPPCSSSCTGDMPTGFTSHFWIWAQHRTALKHSSVNEPMRFSRFLLLVLHLSFAHSALHYITWSSYGMLGFLHCMSLFIHVTTELLLTETGDSVPVQHPTYFVGQKESIISKTTVLNHSFQL